MGDKPNMLYEGIEISDCSDAEDLAVINKKQTGYAHHAVEKQTRTKVNRGRTNETYIKANHLIHSKMKTQDFAAILDELKRLLNEFRRNQKFYEGRGTPLSVLQAIDFLHAELVQGKAEIDPKKKKSASREINQIKKLVAPAHEEFAEEIAKLKDEIDFHKLEEVTDEAVEETQSNVLPTPSISHAPAAVQRAPEAKRVVDEEIDFRARLTLSLDERRKFWLLPKTKAGQQGEKREKGPRTGTRAAQKALARKNIQSEEGAYDNFSLKPEALKHFIRDIYARRGAFDRETLEQELGRTNYALENVTESLLKPELGILAVHLQLERLREDPMPSIDDLGALLSSLRSLVDSLRNNENPVINFNREEQQPFTEAEVLRQLNSFVAQTIEDVETLIKLVDPFAPELPQRLTQEVELIDFLFDFEEFVRALPAEAGAASSLAIAARIVSLIYHISDDFLFSCKPLSEIFEQESISKTVAEYADFIYGASKDDRLTAKIRICQAFNMALNLHDLDKAHAQLIAAQKLGPAVTSDRNLVALFNRALAQLGIAAFRKMSLEKCKFYLFELLSSEDPDTILAQYSIKTERALDLPDPNSTFPYHVHINIKEAKAAFLFASVLTESARTVSYQENPQLSTANKVFTRFLEARAANPTLSVKNDPLDAVFTLYRRIIQFDPAGALSALKGTPLLSSPGKLCDYLAGQARLECLNCYLERLKIEPKTTLDLNDLASLFGFEIAVLKRLLTDKIDSGDLQAKIDENKALLFVNSGLRSILKGDREYDILESLRSFNNLNERIKQVQLATDTKKGTKSYDVCSLIAKKFEPLEKSFHFNYDFAFFKRQAG